MVLAAELKDVVNEDGKGDDEGLASLKAVDACVDL